MSEGRKDVDRIMAPLAGIEAGSYNRIYEAVDELLEAGAEDHARRLVKAVVALIPYPRLFAETLRG